MAKKSDQPQLPLDDSTPPASHDGSITADKSPGEQSPLNFEQSVERLSHIVDQLEEGELPLEESLRLFEEGVKLARASQAKLDAAEKRVEQLLGIDAEGNPIVRTLDPE